MLMISTITLQPPTDELFINVLVYVSTVVEIVLLIIAKNPMTKPALHMTRLNFKRREIDDQMMVAVVEEILVVTKIIKAMGTMNGTNLEWQLLPTLLTVTFTALMEFGWPMANCGKCNTWSGFPNALTTGFHDVALLAGTNYCLPTTHSLHHHCSSNNSHVGTSAPVVNTEVSVPGEGLSANDDFIQIS